MVAQCLSGDVDAYRTTNRYTRADGGTVVGDVSMALLRAPVGTPIHFIVQVVDLTEMVRAIHAKDEFVTHISHELRTPLAAAMAHLELVEDSDGLSPSVQGHVTAVRRNVARLSHFVADLLYAGRATSGSSLVGPLPARRGDGGGRGAGRRARGGRDRRRDARGRPPGLPRGPRRRHPPAPGRRQPDQQRHRVRPARRSRRRRPRGRRAGALLAGRGQRRRHRPRRPAARVRPCSPAGRTRGTCRSPARAWASTSSGRSPRPTEARSPQPARSGSAAASASRCRADPSADSRYRGGFRIFAVFFPKSRWNTGPTRTVESPGSGRRVSWTLGCPTPVTCGA